MISTEEFQAGFLDYAARNRLWNTLQQNHPDEELNDLMLLIIEWEDYVLQRFGLPSVLKYSQILQIHSLSDHLTLISISTIHFRLMCEAEEYLTGDTLTDIELLKRAQNNQSLIDDVLPEISFKLKAEPYYIFVYDMLLRKHISPQSCLEEIRIVSENHLNERILNLKQHDGSVPTQEFGALLDFELKYLDRFLMEN